MKCSPYSNGHGWLSEPLWYKLASQLSQWLSGQTRAYFCPRSSWQFQNSPSSCHYLNMQILVQKIPSNNGWLLESWYLWENVFVLTKKCRRWSFLSPFSFFLSLIYLRILLSSRFCMNRTCEWMRHRCQFSCCRNTAEPFSTKYTECSRCRENLS